MIIGILQRAITVNENKPFDNRLYITEHFIKLANEFDIVLFPIVTEQNIDKIADICDGLLIMGTKSNIRPQYYGEEPLEGLDYEQFDDEFPRDQACIRAFSNQKKPILGICGGMQSINVYYGGTLWQKLKNNHNGKELSHTVALTDGTELQKIYGSNEITVNTFHGQAVKDPAPGFSVSAVSPDGVIEAMEKDNIYGVQWHPEIEPDYKLFIFFFEKVKENMKN